MSIARANDEAMRRRDALRLRRRPIELLDGWLNQVETLIERKDVVVPEPLASEISSFLGRLDLRAHPRHRKRERPKASRVLDLLFAAQEEFLPARSIDPFRRRTRAV